MAGQYIYNYRSLNKKTKKWIIIEVGNTSAEKIKYYTSLESVEEVRWYTKYHKKTGIGLSGQWFVADKSAKANHL
jgi:ATP-dependent RNA circularization protein (DNA/RNA ligase family)